MVYSHFYIVLLWYKLFLLFCIGTHFSCFGAHFTWLQHFKDYFVGKMRLFLRFCPSYNGGASGEGSNAIWRIELLMEVVFFEYLPLVALGSLQDFLLSQGRGCGCGTSRWARGPGITGASATNSSATLVPGLRRGCLAKWVPTHSLNHCIRLIPR